MKELEYVAVQLQRERIAIEKHPAGLDFTKTVNGTTYTVKSHFNSTAAECLFVKVCRLLKENKNLSEQSKTTL